MISTLKQIKNLTRISCKVSNVDYYCFVPSFSEKVRYSLGVYVAEVSV